MNKAGIYSKFKYILKSVAKMLLPTMSSILLSIIERPKEIMKLGRELLLIFATLRTT